MAMGTQKITSVFALVAASLIGLVACQPIDPQQCATTNWFNRGVNDGEAGRVDRLPAYAEACAEAGITPDAASYRAGRTEGLLRFCTVETGFDFASRGRRDPSGVCPADLAIIVSNGWTFGDAIREASEDLEAVDDQLITAAAITSDESISEEERARARAEFRRLSREKERLTEFRDDLLTRYGAYRASVSAISIPGPAAAG